MKIVFTAVVLATMLPFSSQHVAAQSPENPVPNLVVKDADGKTIAQVADLGDPPYDRPVVLLDFGRGPVPFTLVPTTGRFAGGELYFTGANCTGDMHMNAPPASGGLIGAAQTSYLILGPDKTTGTYRFFQTTSPTPVQVFPISRLRWASDSTGVICSPIASSEMFLAPAIEVEPSPLQGFHGPTDANPERGFSFAGGTRLP